LAKEKGKSKIGWFGLTLISTVVVVLTASSIFFFNLFPFDVQSFFTSDKQTTEEEDSGIASEETMEDVEQVQETVGKEHQDIGKFVSSKHDLYNETTGYGGIGDLDWDKQIEQAEHIEVTLEDKIPSVKNQTLKNDLTNVRELADQTMENKDTDNVRELHRMFHDLDIALNSYNGSDKIWNVTETLKEDVQKVPK